MLAKSTFENIGFPVASDKEFAKLIEEIFPLSKIVENDDVKFAIYSDNQIELSVSFNKQNIILSLNPHYRGTIATELGLKELIINTKAQEGMFYVWVDPDENFENGFFPFIFFYPYFFNFDKASLPAKKNVFLAAFPYEIEFYPSVEKYKSKQKKNKQNKTDEIKFAEQYFIPSGLFDESFPSVAQFAGFIENIEEKYNKLTGKKFYQLTVNSLIKLTVLVSKRLVNRKMKVGGILEGFFFISGELEDDKNNL